MIPLKVLTIKTESFALLVRRLKRQINEADVFEIDLDHMRVKGDLAVIQKYFEKPMIAQSTSLDLLKRGIKSGMHYAKCPWSLETDLEFQTMLKNKGAKLIRILDGSESNILEQWADLYTSEEDWFDVKGNKLPNPPFQFL